MASSPQGAHSAAGETAQVHDEIKRRGASAQEEPEGVAGGYQRGLQEDFLEEKGDLDGEEGFP